MTALSHNCQIKKDYRCSSMTWNHKVYYPFYFRGDFVKFIAWMVGNQHFNLTIEGIEFKIQSYFNGNFVYYVPDHFDGTGSCPFIAGAGTREKAIGYLIEQVSEHILSQK